MAEGREPRQRCHDPLGRGAAQQPWDGPGRPGVGLPLRFLPLPGDWDATERCRSPTAVGSQRRTKPGRGARHGRVPSSAAPSRAGGSRGARPRTWEPGGGGGRGGHGSEHRTAAAVRSFVRARDAELPPALTAPSITAARNDPQRAGPRGKERSAGVGCEGKQRQENKNGRGGRRGGGGGWKKKPNETRRGRPAADRRSSARRSRRSDITHRPEAPPAPISAVIPGADRCPPRRSAPSLPSRPARRAALRGRRRSGRKNKINKIKEFTSREVKKKTKKPKKQ